MVSYLEIAFHTVTVILMSRCVATSPILCRPRIATKSNNAGSVY